MFTIDEVLANPLYPEEIEKDVLEEVEKLGRVEKACGWLGGIADVRSVSIQML